MRSKVLFSVVASLLCLGLQANAEISINWTAENGFVQNSSLTGGTPDESIGILDPSINAAGQVYAQLIFTPVASASPAGIGGILGDAGERVLADAVIGRTGTAGNDIDDPGFGGTFYASWLSGAEPALEPFESGFVFGRIFDTTQGAIGVGTWYYDGDFLAIQDLTGTPPPTPQSYGLNRNDLPSGFGDELFLQVVPEPGTFGLLAVGMLTLAYRRRKIA